MSGWLTVVLWLIGTTITVLSGVAVAWRRKKKELQAEANAKGREEERLRVFNEQMDFQDGRIMGLENDMRKVLQRIVILTGKPINGE